MKAKEKRELYLWRKNYPHCNNIYVGELINEKGVRYVPNPYESLVSKQSLFKPGGILYLPNPFDKDFDIKLIANTTVEQFYKNVKLVNQKDVTQDDLADAAFVVSKTANEKDAKNEDSNE